MKRLKTAMAVVALAIVAVLPSQSPVASAHTAATVRTTGKV